ncbi:MAG TPA: phosphodiester glycosidase family protein, partial [Kofleriaceae bacterium]|nr:phosphodiester glycosidase family protein [Kofleriaceae bacterium]
IAIACQRAPRTAVGLTANGNTMLIVVVNGWQTASHGMTAAELAAFLRDRGASYAVALDGGASSSLVIGGALANAPSDGVERAVANHVAIKYGALPKGEMVGFLCATADLPGCGTNPGIRVDGARVTLDDGRSVLATNGYYGFASVTPRLACVTVKKPGYLTKVQCRPVKSGLQTYNSIIMQTGVDMPDAGVPDAPDIIDASIDDEMPRADGGFPDSGGGGGCCDARSDLGGGVSSLFVTVVVAWRLRRRRGTSV